MIIKNLYRYSTVDGIAVSPNIPDGEYTVLYRIIAADGMAVTNNGVDAYSCIDVQTAAGWYEIPAPEPENMG